MKKQLTLAVLGVSALASLIVACVKKDDGAPPPRPPLNSPAQAPAGFGGRIAAGATNNPTVRPQVFDNSIFSPNPSTSILSKEIQNQMFSVRNLDSTYMNAAVRVFSDATNIISVPDPRIYTYLFNGSGVSRSASPKIQSCDIARMIFDFDSRGSLRFGAQLNTLVYEGINIPYEFDPTHNRLYISKFMALARNPNQAVPNTGCSDFNNRVAGIGIMPTKTADKKAGFIVVDLVPGQQTMHIRGNLNVNYMASEQLYVGSATPRPFPVAAPAVAGAAAPVVAPVPIVIANPDFFRTGDTRFIGGDIMLLPIAKGSQQ
jgi:hypothetical protein